MMPETFPGAAQEPEIVVPLPITKFRRAARDGATRHSVAGPSAGAARVLLIVGYFAPVPVKRDTESAREFA